MCLDSSTSSTPSSQRWWCDHALCRGVRVASGRSHGGGGAARASEHQGVVVVLCPHPPHRHRRASHSGGCRCTIRRSRRGWLGLPDPGTPCGTEHGELRGGGSGDGAANGDREREAAARLVPVGVVVRVVATISDPTMERLALEVCWWCYLRRGTGSSWLKPPQQR
jgi:hypothetical protein